MQAIYTVATECWFLSEASPEPSATKHFPSTKAFLCAPHILYHSGLPRTLGSIIIFTWPTGNKGSGKYSYFNLEMGGSKLLLLTQLSALLSWMSKDYRHASSKAHSRLSLLPPACLGIFMQVPSPQSYGNKQRSAESHSTCAETKGKIQAVISWIVKRHHHIKSEGRKIQDKFSSIWFYFAVYFLRIKSYVFVYDWLHCSKALEAVKY